jgi:hypothetical protein
VTAADCPDPGHCPVPSPRAVDLRRLRLVRIPAGRAFHTAFRRRHWPELFRASSSGDARFSPLAIEGSVVPTLYLAATQTVALLETAFHDVHAGSDRVISESLHLRTRGLVTLWSPVSLSFIDLRDEALARLGLTRAALVSTTPDHYPCTREWAVELHGRLLGRVRPAGILWRSRLAELAARDSPLLGDLLAPGSDVCLVFGDRVPTDAAAWHPGDPQYPDLSSGQGRLLAEQIAEQLDAVIVPA